ncbi:MAG: hemolysin family protein [Desulfococcaceae bacterium]
MALLLGLPALALAASIPVPDVQAEPTRADVILLFLYVFMALVFSFLCSISEAVILTVTPPFIEGLKNDKPRLAHRLWRLKVDNVDRSLAAILTLNTIAHTVGALGAGAKATAVFGNAFFGLFSAIMTLMILFLSEIIPKTLGAVYWRSLAGMTAIFVQYLIWAMYPLILVSELLTKWLARGDKAHSFSRDEFIAMANMGEQAGQLKEDESRIIRNLFMLDKVTAEDIMTPRPVIEALQEGMTVGQASEQTAEIPFSRLPIFGENRDDITGFVLKDDILLCHAQGQSDVTLDQLKREIPSVPESMPLRNLLEFLLEQRRSHIALVVDEYGGTEGLVTLEDAVETLLGMEIVDEVDENVDMQVLARSRWKKRAREMGINPDRALELPPRSPEANKEERGESDSES